MNHVSPAIRENDKVPQLSFARLPNPVAHLPYDKLRVIREGHRAGFLIPQVVKSVSEPSGNFYGKPVTIEAFYYAPSVVRKTNSYQIINPKHLHLPKEACLLSRCHEGHSVLMRLCR